MTDELSEDIGFSLMKQNNNFIFIWFYQQIESVQSTIQLLHFLKPLPLQIFWFGLGFFCCCCFLFVGFLKFGGLFVYLVGIIIIN